VTSAQDLLSRLVGESAAEMERRRAVVPERELEARAGQYTPRDFTSALRKPGLAVIAEMKRRTPSMGVLAADYRPDQLARTYSEGGAAALSVLTQETSFGGSLGHLEAARANTELPILRKDFICDPYQVLEARAAGADAVLLIVAALPPAVLASLLAAANDLGLAALLEVHDEGEVAVALTVGAELPRIIGVNHRDLRTFEVDLGLTDRLRGGIPRDVVVVSESGIRGVADARRMRVAHADAILVGETLMRAPDPAACIRELASA
jgi:indole-3-glycerol phosphate synthase